MSYKSERSYTYSRPNYNRGSSDRSHSYSNGRNYSNGTYKNSDSSYRSYNSRSNGYGSNNGLSNSMSQLRPYSGNSEPIQKNFFKPGHIMQMRSHKEIEDYRCTKEITVEGNDIPGPIINFTDYELPMFFTQEAAKQSFVAPTPIQAQSWPICLSGMDLVGIARTGSGKTLSYMLPVIVHILNQPTLKYGDGPIALILAPTRELAQQILEVAKQFGASENIRSICLFGGAPKGPQIGQLRNGAEICIATPGRLIDLLSMGKTNLNRCSFLCLDEADRMLDMGFEPQIKAVIQGIRNDRQTLMFSATWPKEVKKLARDYLHEPAMLRVGSMDLAANHNILQIVDVCSQYEKEEKLSALLSEMMQEQEHKVIIFAQTKKKVDGLTTIMRQAGWGAKCIHGDKSQDERDRVLRDFRSGRVYILVATDVAARGLDVDDVMFVVNYDYPNNSEDYVHRIGRTGRSNNKGTAYTFFTNDDYKQVKDLIAILEEAKQEINPKLYEVMQIGGGFGSRNGGRHYGNGYKKSYGYGRSW